VIVTVVPVSGIVDGAVNNPAEVIEPAEALHVTGLCPDAVNGCVAPRATETVPGETVIGGAPPVDAGGFKVIVEAADFVVSAALVAVTVTMVFAATEAGAVYVIELPEVDVAAPSFPAPVDGLIVQLTPRFVAFATVAVKPCVPPPERLTVEGEMEIVTAGVVGCVNVTVAVPF
jgi:hypothetical protein